MNKITEKKMVKVPFKSDVSEEEKIQLFDELGLSIQKENLKSNIKAKEIISIMEGEEYKEVSLKDVEDLFEFKKLSKAVSKHNWKVLFKSPAFYWAAFTFPICLYCVYKSINMQWNDLTPSSFGQYVAFSLLGLLIAFIAFICYGFVNFGFSGFPDPLELKLEVEDVAKTNIEIPWAAALRMKEAKDKNIFDNFVIAYPNLITKPIPRNSSFGDDPAILGVKRIKDVPHYYMIVYYDIEKDKQEILNKI